MNITRIRIWRVQPPHDAWNLVSIETRSGLTGWGEFTGSGHEAAAAAIVTGAAPHLAGRDALDAEALLSPFRSFRYPPVDDKIATVAWSAIAQALWDLRGQAFGQPLCRLLGGMVKPVRLYANLNRGLFRDRSPEGHARHAEEAMDRGFAYAKCTPFDGLTPAIPDGATLDVPMERLRRAAAAAGAERIAVDCHCRFSPPAARKMLEAAKALGRFAWIEDILSPVHRERFRELRHAFPETVWAGGEETRSLGMAAAVLTGPDRPDIFMPDVKYICGPDEYAAIVRLAGQCGCLLYPHNPSGPISLAFSAHLAALGGDCLVEYPFMAVPGQETLTAPEEPVENGWYYLRDAPGLGMAPSRRCLDDHGTVLHETTA